MIYLFIEEVNYVLFNDVECRQMLKIEPFANKESAEEYLREEKDFYMKTYAGFTEKCSHGRTILSRPWELGKPGDRIILRVEERELR